MKRLLQPLFLFATLTVCSNTEPLGPSNEVADPIAGQLGVPRGPLAVPPPVAPVPPGKGPPPAAGPDAELIVVKTAFPADVTIGPGDPIAFDIRVTNNGPGTALNVLLTDDLPDLGSTWTVSKTGGPPFFCDVNGSLFCYGPDFSNPFPDGIELRPGEFFSVRVSSLTNEGDCGTVNNTAEAFGDNAPLVSDSASVVIICPQL